jgi:hypothetical protein
MGLTYAKEEQLKEQPVIKVQIFKSKEGNLIVHRTTITDIKPAAYYETVLRNSSYEEDEEVLEE